VAGLAITLQATLTAALHRERRTFIAALSSATKAEEQAVSMT
jgi:hypothetical protein